MKVYPPEKIRNLVFVGARGVGKTTFLDALAFIGGLNSRHGHVADGTSFFDTDPAAVKRQATVQGSCASLEWKGCKVTLLDTPGFADFFGDAIANICAADIVVLCVDAVNGVQIHTKRLSEFARQHRKPIVLLLTKMDHPQANAQATLARCREALDARFALMQMPIGSGPQFAGVVGLFHLRAYTTAAGRTTVVDASGELLSQAMATRTEIMDDIAETDETLMEKYLAGTPLSDADLHHGMAKGIDEGTVIPVVFSSGATLAGGEAFLNMAVDWLPGPHEVPERTWETTPGSAVTLAADSRGKVVAHIFRVTADPGIGEVFFFRVIRGSIAHGMDLYNAQRQSTERMGHLFVVQGRERIEVAELTAGDIGAVAKLKLSGVNDTLCDKAEIGRCPAIPFPVPMVQLAITPKTKADQDKLGGALSKLTTIDPTFTVHVDPQFHETVIAGLGEIHLEVMLERLHERYKIEFDVGRPHIPYKERLQKKVKVQGKYKKQSGGRGQYGDCSIEVTPLPIGSGVVFEEHIFGGAIPGKYLPAIEKGVREAMQRGGLAGYPLDDVKVDVVDGSYHDVDSSDMAFQIAGSMAIKKAQDEARSVLIEPIMDVDITTPQTFVGDLTSDISGRVGRVQGMENMGDHTVIHAQIPLAQLHAYATQLRAITRGAASHTMHFSHYDVVPAHLAEKVIAAARREHDVTEKRAG
ncbi:MAG: elongation factor G [Deltaproteobacteria bacterium]|nr:elongation factor G [Deltaproteobacteria bacterium]